MSRIFVVFFQAGGEKEKERFRGLLWQSRIFYSAPSPFWYRSTDINSPSAVEKEILLLAGWLLGLDRTCARGYYL
jgi:hypothetical protein